MGRPQPQEPTIRALDVPGGHAFRRPHRLREVD
jgi:hypothetical protein